MIRIENLRMEYPEEDGGRRCVLDVPRLEIAAGEQLALRGGSGSGKTTLLNLLAGILRPTSGRVEVEGTDLGTLSQSARDRFRAARIGYVFQTFNLLQGFSARENVWLPAAFAKRSRGAMQRRAGELLTRLGIAHRARAHPARLSVGEQQRVAIARAVINEPAIVLADEPTANLDPDNAGAVLGLLREVCQEHGSTLLLVTHEPEVQRGFPKVLAMEEVAR